MKKHLIAAAVAAAVVAPAAMAQNVTISGRLDVGYSMLDATTAAGVGTKTNVISFSPWTTSRLIIAGTEDLGGGLKAAFNIETAMGSSTVSAVSAADTTKATSTGGTTIGDRQLNLTLSGGFGSLLAGRTDSMVKTVYDAYDAGYSNNIVGSVDSLDAATDTTTRRDVTIRYTTPSFSGLTASIGVMKNTVDKDATAKVEDQTGEEYGLRYVSGPLSASLAYRNVDVKSAAVVAPAVPTGAAKDLTNKDLGLGISYNFGPVVAFGQYFDTESKPNGGTKTDEKFYAVGVRVPLGASTIYASYVDGESKTGATKLDREGFQLGVKYDFSKRTYAYVAYGDEESNATATTKAKKDQLAIGIAHHF